MLQSDGTYAVKKYSGSLTQDAVKFVTSTTSLIGAKEAAIDAKLKIIESLQSDYAVADEDDAPEIQKKIDALENEINEIYKGSASATGLYSLMAEAFQTVKSLKVAKDTLAVSQAQQSAIEKEFSDAMGDMLKDGYWANKNYVEGQEQFLYSDALDMSAELAKPFVTYTISPVQASDIWGNILDEYLINSKVRIYDPDLQINDIVYVTKIVDYLDDNSKGSVEISNDELSITGKTFDSVLGRVSQIADMIDQKGNLIDRANTIGKDGSINVGSLEGTIDLLKNRLLSSTSNWYTDDNGNIIFLSVNGKSAMM